MHEILSKGLGFSIVVGGSIMKVPQILLSTSPKLFIHSLSNILHNTVINACSARGLSLPAYIFKTLSYSITLAYSFQHQFSFSTYSENLFLMLQNILITLLIIHHAPLCLRSSSKTRKFITTFLAILASLLTLYTLPTHLSLLQLTTSSLSLFSKLPQIQLNHCSKSTGQLSAFAVISQIAGCLMQLFTMAQEVGNSLFTAGFALAFAVNVVLGVQLWVYNTAIERYQKPAEAHEFDSTDEKARSIVQNLDVKP